MKGNNVGTDCSEVRYYMDGRLNSQNKIFFKLKNDSKPMLETANKLPSVFATKVCH